MMARSAIFLMVLLTATAAGAADLGAPRLSEPLATRTFFDPDRLLTTGGIQYKPAQEYILEPQFGLGYEAREIFVTSGQEETVQKLHAQAGGKIGISQVFSLSAAAKLPVYTYGSTDRRVAGALFGDTVSTRQDILRLSGGNLSWTGEVGIRLGAGVDLNLFYDQRTFDTFQGGSPAGRSDDRFGTRIIFRFK